MTRNARDHAMPQWASVPQQYVHKLNPAEVLLTAWRETGEQSLAVRGRWPRSHPFYLGGGDEIDPLLFTETVRQTLPLVSHALHDVPLGHHLLWESYDFALEPGAALPPGPDRDVMLHITCSDIRRRGTRATALTLHTRVTHDGTPLGTAVTRFHIQPPAVYRRLRGEYADLESARARALPAPAPLPHRLTGRTRPEDVVLSPAGGATDRWQLRVDLDHPVLFDHPVDHVPGILLLDAARQAARALRHPRPVRTTGMRTRFTRYVELDAPCWVQAEKLGPDRVCVVIRQHERTCFDAELTLASGPARDTAGRSSRPAADLTLTPA
ncbi:ScbA/BarX family gamma-butyrolactone biosynthesis protein [Streptomyces fumanus]|uniref:Adhesin n=1 Tax=Streptomyces fumanus TaxID=67302 RepID=A0A919ASL6_9ACTN|nr:ScbA/BarX family gamma-butyrolactone biosynthesis protein [Streptomyces fumanus]GHF24388.1 adhesin [Streptomyces fumanus]